MTSFKSLTMSGVRWTSLNMLSTTFLQFIQLVILARFLGPKAYGLMGIIMVVTGFAGIFAEMGLSTAIIQRKNPSQNQLSSLYWINLAAGFFVYFVFWLTSPLIAAGFGIPDLNPLLRVAAISFVIGPFGSQFQALLQKSLRFDAITKISIIALLMGMGVSISCAVMGLGVWSLIWGNLANMFASTGFYVLMGWKMFKLPRLHFNWSDGKGYINFGLYRVGAMSINQFNSRIDQLFIGLLMGPVALGYYNIAFRLVIQPVQKINPILTKVAFPVFSIIQDDTDRLKRGFLRMIRFLMSINAPVLIGLAAVAPVAVPLLLGEKWVQSVPLVQVLAFYMLIRSLGNASGSLIIAKGKANWAFYWNVALTLFIPVVVYLASLCGEIIYIPFALVGMQIILFLFYYRFFIRNLIGPCFMEYLNTFLCPVLLALAMSGIVIGCTSFMPMFNRGVIFPIQVIIGFTVYILFSWFFQKNLLIEFIELIPHDFGLKEHID